MNFQPQNSELEQTPKINGFKFVCTVSVLFLCTSLTAAQKPSTAGDITDNPERYVLSHAENGATRLGLREFDCSGCSAMKNLLFVTPALDCGTAGCNFYVLKKTGEKSYEYLTTVFLAEGGFQFLETKHNGLNDILSYGHASAVEGSLNRYEFDGKDYRVVQSEMIKAADFESHISPERVRSTYRSVADVEGLPPNLPAQPNNPRPLTLIYANDPQMDPLLKASFPGMENIIGYQAMRPFFLLVRNDTPYPVSAFTVEWDAEAPTQTGYITRWASSFVQKRFGVAPGNEPFNPETCA